MKSRQKKNKKGGNNSAGINNEIDDNASYNEGAQRGAQFQSGQTVGEMSLTAAME